VTDDVDALADRVASLPPAKQIDVLLGMLEKVGDERDRLRAELDTANAELEDANRFERDARQVEAERDRLRRLLTDVFTAIYPVPTGPGGPVDHTELPAHVAALRAERDRLRAVVDAQAASLARLKEFAESEILDRVSAELGADLRAQLDASPTGEGT
jgi:hypothetical protein